MRILQLGISNFRGIRESTINFPVNSRLICLIGSGDNTKSTILKAIEWLIWPSSTLPVNDTDFYMLNTNESIIITGTFPTDELPDEFNKENKYGLYFRKLGAKLDNQEDDEPIVGMPTYITMRLTINSDLDSIWEIVCNRLEPRQVSTKDRRLLSCCVTGNDCSKDLTWGKYSILQQYANTKDIIHDVQTDVLRNVANKADFSNLNNTIHDILDTCQDYGVNVEDEIKSCLLYQSGSSYTRIGLSDGKIPFLLKGTGSQRLLSIGLNIKISKSNSIILLDEIESGLEPYRLRSLINELRETHQTVGQVITTTHSPVAVAAFDIKDEPEIMVVHSKDGGTEAITLLGENKDANKALQSELRVNPEAFLSERLIVCEGKTEIGFIMALDKYIKDTSGFCLAYKGINSANGQGTKIFSCAEQLNKCGYKTCLLMDSDLPDINKKKDSYVNPESIFDWDRDAKNSFEEQVFYDVPADVASQILQIAISEYGSQSIAQQLKNSHVYIFDSDGNFSLWGTTQDVRRSIGTVAKTKIDKNKEGWFKRIDLGKKVGTVIFDNWDKINRDSVLYKTISKLKDWIINYGNTPGTSSAS